MQGSLWVFGYGSLMWNPGFDFVRAERARLHGAHRALCILSTKYRGTPERPGLVYGLDAGGSCVGMAFEVAPELAEATRAYLHAREMITHVYREEMRPVRLACDGAVVSALVYIARPEHPQYAGRLSAAEVEERVRPSTGAMGANADYVLSTADHLRALGLRDRPLEALAKRLRAKPSPT